jgi:hypothetical protein
MKNIDEIWKEINGFESYYLISNFGRVKLNLDKPNIAFRLSKTKDVNGLLHIGKNGRKGDEYSCIKLTLNNKRKTYRIHRLVAETFIANLLNLPCVNHKDGDKMNNHVINLEWVTYKQNAEHAWKLGLYDNRKIDNSGENNGRSILEASHVIKIRKLYENDNYSKKQLAEMFNTTVSNIYSIITYRNWKHIVEK